MLHPDIQRQIHHLQVRKACQIRPVSAGNGTVLPDRFYLDISYCGLTMRWQVGQLFNRLTSPPSPATQVIFQQINVQWVPDFVFNHPAFHPLNTTSHGVDQLRTAIANFDIDNPKHLDHVIDLLLASYSQFQLAQLHATPWAAVCMKPELQAIANHQGSRLAYVPGGAAGGDQVRLAVPLTMVDLAQLQPFICNTWALEYEYEQVTVDSLCEQLQLIIVHTLNRGQTTLGIPELQLEVPRALETFLGHAQLPEWPPSEVSCISDYLPRCVGRLEGLLRAMQDPLTKRHAYLDNLVLALGRPLEVDTVHARSAAFLVAIDSVAYVLSVYVTAAFPEEQPRLLLQVHQPQPDLKIYKDYPWSPRWAAQEMVARTVMYLRDEVAQWKRFPIEGGA